MQIFHRSFLTFPNGLSKPLERPLLVRLKLIALTLAMLSALLGAACGGGGGSGEADAFLKMLPDDARGALYVNMAQVWEDGDLVHFRLMIEDQMDGDFSSDYGIRVRDVGYIAFAEVDDYDIYVFGGLDDREALRDKLQAQGYEEKGIRGVEVWTRASKSREAFAFLPDGSVLVTENEELAEDLLRRRDRGSASLYEEVSHVASSLSTDIAVVVKPYCPDSLDCDFEGISFQKESSWDFRLKRVFAFSSEANAEDAYNRWVAPLTTANTYCYNEKLSRDGSSLTYEVICDMQDLDKVYLLAFGFL